ncbi:hypothetical protein [Leptothoe kymatousa]|uniref:hypothetical protein n=1 Tax=Leptothoe kymatousa TaxID=2651727 RepID=UPI001C01A624|nr:hypothetical protein [Leptothoe kymatousa]
MGQISTLDWVDDFPSIANLVRIDHHDYHLIAFSIAEGHSGQIQVSEVLPGLKMSLVEEALVRSQTADDGAITRWLMQTLG